MKLSISNIAWDVCNDEAIAHLLRENAVHAIDVAPGKYFSQPTKATTSDIIKVKKWWQAFGIDIVGMQSLLFGTTGLNVFGDSQSQKSMLSHLEHICRIGAGFGATRLVFGSPRNRDRLGLSDAQAIEQGVDFFSKLGSIANRLGVVICLEPNPTCYGANFMTDTTQTANIVKTVDMPSIKMQLDTGALTINEENPYEILESYAPLIGHIHASEPQLKVLGDGRTDHKLMGQAIREKLPEKFVTIEMLSDKDKPQIQSVTRALSVAIKYYR